jgi:hypothetical protein
MAATTGIEPAFPTLTGWCTTIVLHNHGSGTWTRTRRGGLTVRSFAVNGHRNEVPRFAVQNRSWRAACLRSGCESRTHLARLMRPFSATGAVTRSSPTETRTLFRDLKGRDLTHRRWGHVMHAPRRVRTGSLRLEGQARFPLTPAERDCTRVALDSNWEPSA